MSNSTNSNLYVYLKKLFPDTKPVTMTGTVVSKDGASLIIEDVQGRKLRVNNFTGNDYIVGTSVYISDGIIIGRTSARTGATSYVV